jgi:peptidoglycan L-alanyl-D-glutamate endopeptidase CwlK
VRQWSERSLRNLAGIHPDLRRVMDRALQESPIDMVINEGLRTLARQRKLLAIKATKTLNSRHITGHAIDFYAMVDIDTDGDIEFVEMSNPRLMTQIAKAIKAAAVKEDVAIVWGGDWRTFKDLPHVELDRRKYPA